MEWLSKALDNVRRGFRMENGEPKELDREEFRALLESRVQESLDMSLDEFTAALESGRLDPESPRVAGLAILVGARAG